MTAGPDEQPPQPPRLVRQRQVARRIDFDNNEVARHLDFDDNIPPPPLRLVRQHAQIMQPDEEDAMDMDIEGGSRRRKKTNRRKRKTNKRKTRGGNKKRRSSSRKSRK